MISVNAIVLENLKLSEDDGDGGSWEKCTKNIQREAAELVATEPRTDSTFSQPQYHANSSPTEHQLGYVTPQENLHFSNLFILSPRLAIQSI